MLQTDIVPAALDESELLGLQSISDPVMSTAQNLTELALRFLINLLFCGLIVHFFYYPKSLRKDYVFTFLTFSSYNRKNEMCKI